MAYWPNRRCPTSASSDTGFFRGWLRRSEIPLVLAYTVFAHVLPWVSNNTVIVPTAPTGERGGGPGPRHHLQPYGHRAQALGFSESLKRALLRVTSCPTSTSSDVSLRDQPGWLWALRVHPRPLRVQGSQVWMRVKLVCFSCLRSQCLCRSALRVMCLVCNPDGF